MMVKPTQIPHLLQLIFGCPLLPDGPIHQVLLVTALLVDTEGRASQTTGASCRVDPALNETGLCVMQIDILQQWFTFSMSPSLELQ